MYIEQTNHINNKNFNVYQKSFISHNAKFNQYLYLPVKMFYENSETFINTEGLMKRTSKIIETKKNKNNWKLLRNLLKKTKKELVFIDLKNNCNIYYNLKKTEL